MLTINDVKPYGRNVKDHPETQIELIAKVIREIGWRVPVEVNQEGDIVAGHGRWIVWETYKDEEGFPPIWVIDGTGKTIHGKHDERPLTKDQETMWRIADNKITELATWNLLNLGQEMEAFEMEEYKQFTGFENFEMPTLEDPAGSESSYTEKIEIPSYEPKAEKPEMPMLVDTTKRDELVAEIEASTVSEEIKEFLKLSAQRHLKFNYEAIAEFYAHSSKEEQVLFENAMLVIVDFNKAIEKGFVDFADFVLNDTEDEQE